MPLVQIAIIFIGINILRLKAWARKTLVCFSLIGFIGGVVSIIFLAPLPLGSKTSLVIFDGLYLYFFTRPKVKEQFR